MTIWVDADSCPRAVRDIVVRAARRTKVAAIFVANRPVPGIAADSPSFLLCPQGADAADDLIVERSSPGDLAVTRDIPLAARLVAAGVRAVNDRGTTYTAENVRERLSLRNFMMELNANGISPERVDGYGRKELKAFADGFDRELSRLLRAERSRTSIPPAPDTAL